jgi:hypothetical protein
VLPGAKYCTFRKVASDHLMVGGHFSAQTCHMSKMSALSLLPMSITKTRISGILLALSIVVCVTLNAKTAIAADDLGAGGNAALQLAAKIAAVDAGRDHNKSGLVADYEKVYGKIDRVPARWPALVRRVLVCQQTDDQICVRSSMEAIENIGGINAFPLTHLFEVSRYGMSVETIHGHLHDAETKSDDADMAASKPAPTRQVATIIPASVPDRNASSDPPATSTPAPTAASTTNPAVSVASNAPVKSTVSKTLLQRASTRLGKLGTADASGFFLDALFIMAAVLLLSAYFLFSAMRGRRTERRERLHALQEIQRLEDFVAEEKVRTDHVLWSEQLKAEVTLEAQKSHADELLRQAQQAKDAAIEEGRLRATESHKAELLKIEQVIQFEKARMAEAVKAEQLKTEEAIKSAKFRADQAIDAYDQMAARELVYAHKHNDELQEALNAEQERREAQELKTEEALQAVETFKVREKKLLEIIRAEQRVRASEARQAAEKLKAAQQAAAALQASLVATRALKADLERRADEAMQAAEARIAEARQLHASPAIQAVPSVQASGESSGPYSPAGMEMPPTDAVALKDAHSG